LISQSRGLGDVYKRQTTLTLTGSTGTIAWQKSTNWTAATPTWTAVTGTTTTLATGALTLSTAYRAALTSGTCTSVNTSSYVVTVGPVTKSISQNTTTPSGVDATNALCISSTSKILTLASGYVGTIQWQRSVNSGTTWTDISGATAATYTVSGSSVGANMFRIKLTTGTCPAVYSSNSLTIYYKSCMIKKDLDSLQVGVFDAFVFPNPSNDAFNVSILSVSNEPVSIFVHDIAGNLIHEKQINSLEDDSYNFGNDLSVGTYYVTISQGSNVKRTKIMKQ
jgi:hypothetical protein